MSQVFLIDLKNILLTGIYSQCPLSLFKLIFSAVVSYSFGDIIFGIFKRLETLQ